MGSRLARHWSVLCAALAIALGGGASARATDLTGLLGTSGTGRFAKCVGSHLGWARSGTHWALVSSDSEFHGRGVLEVDDDGFQRIHLNFATESDGRRHPDFRGKEIFAHLMEYFHGRFQGVRGSWAKGSLETNINLFNQRFREVYPRLLAEAGGNAEAATQKAAMVAAAGTWTGERALERGMTTIRVERLVGAPGNFDAVSVTFDFPARVELAPPPARTAEVHADPSHYRVQDSGARELELGGTRGGDQLWIMSSLRTGSGQSSPVVNEATEIPRMFEHFSGRPIRKVYWVLSRGFDLAEFNRLTSPPSQLSEQEAAAQVLSGRAILAQGFRLIGVKKAAKSQGKYLRVEIELVQEESR